MDDLCTHYEHTSTLSGGPFKNSPHNTRVESHLTECEGREKSRARSTPKQHSCIYFMLKADSLPTTLIVAALKLTRK